MKRARAIQTLCGVILVTTAQRVAAQNATIEGQTVLHGGALTIGYTVVSTTPGGSEQFSGADGRFVIRDVRPGTVHLIARRIGYAPFDTALDVHAGDTLRVRIELHLVTIQLPAVHTLAKACAHPGGSRELIGPDLAILFDQVQQNADRNRLLARTYPFELAIERRITKPEPLLDARFIAYDTVRRSSLREWRYAPGRMLGTREIESGVFGGKWITLTMPELADFADSVFLDVPVLDLVSSAVFPRVDPKSPPIEPATETQRTLSVRFLKGRPR